MNVILKACCAGVLILWSGNSLEAHAAGRRPAGITSAREAGPLVTALLALALIAQGGKRRLRM